MLIFIDYTIITLVESLHSALPIVATDLILGHK